MRIKLLVGVIFIIVVTFGMIIYQNQYELIQNDETYNKTIKIGAILPLTGSASLFGENMKNGIMLALENNDLITVSYEDSKALPADGVSAYQKLIATGVDVVISVFSGVSVPLTNLAMENKIPLIMSIVAADNVTNEYSYRYYARPENYVKPAFESLNSPMQDKKNLAVLYRNDEFGISVHDVIKQQIEQNDKNIVADESFLPNETDFSSVITKIKSTKPEVLLFVAATPAEAIAIVTQAYELKLDAILIENSSVLSDSDVQKQAPLFMFYTTAFQFAFPNNSVEFKQEYTNKFEKSPNFAAVFGYDIGNLIAYCVDTKTDIQTCLSNTKNISGLAGDIDNIENHEINSPMFLMKVN